MRTVRPFPGRWAIAVALLTAVSLGAQTFARPLLETLERRTTPDQVRAAVDKLRHAGVASLSLDLIYGIPGERESDLARDLAVLDGLPRPAGIYLNEVQGFMPREDQAVVRARALEEDFARAAREQRSMYHIRPAQCQIQLVGDEQSYLRNLCPLRAKGAVESLSQFAHPIRARIARMDEARNLLIRDGLFHLGKARHHSTRFVGE